jgi:hypothetical protein
MCEAPAFHHGPRPLVAERHARACGNPGAGAELKVNAAAGHEAAEGKREQCSLHINVAHGCSSHRKRTENTTALANRTRLTASDDDSKFD